MPALKHSDYTVGWICALPLELAASMSMLDETHKTLSSHSRSDRNIYTLGKIGGHNVVMACLPAGQIGTHNAATVAAQMMNTFEFIRFGLMVGVGGGVPSAGRDIRLGDVVVSKPLEQFGGVVQYDFGRTVEDGWFKRTSSLNAPPRVLLNALSILMAKHEINPNLFSRFLSNVLSTLPPTFSHPGADEDRLFEAEYDHVDGATCAKCDFARLVSRKDRDSLDPHIHYGTIASGNRVIRDGTSREQLRQEYDMLCFEMEAAGLMNDFPCIVIRGICDYADSHKNKSWQRYAATVAAAYAKELLSIIPPEDVSEIPGMPPIPHPDNVTSTFSSAQLAPGRDSNCLSGENSRFLVPPNDPLPSGAAASEIQNSSTLPAFSFMTSGCLGPKEVTLGRMVLNLDEPADDYCPYAPITITREKVSVVPFRGIASLLASPKGSRIATYLARVFSDRIDQELSVPQWIAKTTKTSKLLNSGDFFKRLIQDEETKRWLESVYKKRDVYLAVGIHSFADEVGSSTDSVDTFDAKAAFSIPGNWIIGVRYRRVQVKGFHSSKVDSAFLNHNGRWKKYVVHDPNREDDETDILEASLDDKSPLDDLTGGYNVGIYCSEETGEHFLLSVISFCTKLTQKEERGSNIILSY